MSPQPNMPIVYDYKQFEGPYCLDHRSVMCEHSIEEIANRHDADEIEAFLENDAIVGRSFKLMIPLWPAFYMWQPLEFAIRHTDTLGTHGELDTVVGAFELGVKRILPGESVRDIGEVMVGQFRDAYELDPPRRLPGCKSGVHTMQYQVALERLFKYSVDEALPHLYALMDKTICGWCWSDLYGIDARRVSSNPDHRSQVDDMADLIPEG